jgi:ATP/maltotriose-dependent transcriptional regulator MalT/DNA-binding response OmpR family regulator
MLFGTREQCTGIGGGNDKMELTSPPNREESYQAGDLLIDVARRLVRRNGVTICLPRLSFELLLALAKEHPRMLTIEELMRRVWAPAVVNPETVGQRVKLLRRSIGEDPKKPCYVVGVRGQGYRMDVPVTARAPTAANEVTVRTPMSLAKITEPSPRRALNRDTVFSLLDQYAERRLIWLSAPAGYGKTTAVITYLRARHATRVWYQCDAGDADIASFFHYVSLASRVAIDQALAPTSAFSVENFAAVPAFTRKFFRTWFSRLPSGTVWVLDNWQDIPAGSTLLELLPVIVEEIPAGVKLIVLSRTGPAANMTRLAATLEVPVLAEKDLRLSKEETGALAAMYERPSDQTSVMTTDELYASTHGWPAGVTVMLRHDAEMPLMGANPLHQSLSSAFNFLSTEVFDRLAAEVRDLLIKTACLDYVAVPVAQHISGRDNARDILNSLVDQNAFTTHRRASDTYHYHPLFHELLRNRMDALVGSAGRRELQIAAARSLERENDPEQAIHLLLLAGEWPAAAALIVAVAPILVQQARFQTLSVWISKLPAAVSAAHAWISYWHGVVQIAIDFSAARHSLECAYALFMQSSDPLGQMLATSAILQHIGYTYIEFVSMLPWISRLVTLLHDDPPFPSPAVELQVMTGLLLALTQVQPNHPILPRCVARVTRLIDEPVDLTSNASGVAALLHFHGMFGRMASYRGLDDRVQSLLQRPELSPGARIHILWMDAYQRFLRGAGDESFGLLDSADVIAREHGLSAFELRIQLSRLQLKDVHRHAAELPAAFGDLEPPLTRAPPMVVGHARYLRAMYHLAKRELHIAQRMLDDSLRLAPNSGWVAAICMNDIATAQIRAEFGDYDGALDSLAACDARIDGLDAPTFRFHSSLVKAEIARRRGSPAYFAAALGAALSIGREQGYANCLHAYDLLLPRLIPYALRSGIEIDYCRWVIVQRSFVPPLGDVPHWPWPVRIKALGALELFVDDAPVKLTGKPQHKPIDLLKVLLTQSNGVDTVRLMDTLWPDSEGDAARNAFDLAVHRLRKLLVHKDVVILSGGRLSLNPRLVWVDAFVLERLSAEGFAAIHLTEEVSNLLALYRGALLIDDEGSAIFAARKRLRSRFVRSVAALADQLGEAGQWDLAGSLCRRAVEVEPLEEALYRVWMRGLVAQGREMEAEAVYRSCEETLAALSRGRPSRSTSDLLPEARRE